MSKADSIQDAMEDNTKMEVKTRLAGSANTNATRHLL